MLSRGQKVTIRGAAGTCPGEVIHAETPDTLPELNGPGERERVRAITAEWQIVELALIRHTHAGRLVSFFALRDRGGAWRDLQGQHLTIEENPCT